ncbi:MAG TPA: TetR/AcrR family transcriptional regulator [Bryobacteraceae bacterium]|nr:TetR/AcrR family transcriptional regulator [Bryobacteraceae bacterium]
MPETCLETIDPRIRRTRQLLRQALEKLLETKEFDKISVQDIADTAPVNRATFYDHYPDKFALLDCLVAMRFDELLALRNVKFDGTCSSALTGMVLSVCDYLAGTPVTDCTRQRQMEPHLESAVIGVVRRMILDGLKQHPSANNVSPEMIAATVSWAMYGAAKEWVRTPNRCPSEQIVGTVVQLVSPILAPLHANPLEAPDAK